MNSLLKIVLPMLFVGAVVSCGSDGYDGSGGGVDRLQADELNWTAVEYEQLSATPPQACTEAEHFDISPEGTWEWQWCDDEKSGELSSTELTDLNDKIERVRQTGFAPEPCLEISYTGRNTLDVTFRPSTKIRLHSLDRSGSCYRGEHEKVDDLEQLIVDLKDRYTGFSTQPQ